MLEAKKRVQAQIHPVPVELQLQAKHHKREKSGGKVYPASDSEEMFYSMEKGLMSAESRRRRRASCDSLSTTGSGNSIADATVGEIARQADGKTLVLLMGPTPRSYLAQKQRSWETFPRPKSKRQEQGNSASLGQLKKADSFEGHEEAVRTLVAAVQETRSQLRQHHLHHHHLHRHHRKSKTN